MNKQEAIKELMSKSREVIFGDDENVYLSRKRTIELVSQIDEPQKPVVPKFVADFYESIKDDFESKVYDLCVQFDRDSDELSSDVCGWFDCVKNEPIQTLVEMKLYGYEVVHEKLYTVEIPDPYGLYKIRYLFRNSVGNVRIGGVNYRDIFLTTETHLTESEIKQDFKWAWDAGFAKEVE